MRRIFDEGEDPTNNVILAALEGRKVLEATELFSRLPQVADRSYLSI
jgi:hypothetical protein